MTLTTINGITTRSAKPKLSKKLRARLEAICRNLEDGHKFIMHDDTALMRKHALGSCDFFECVGYAPYAGQKWSPIVKGCGNRFVPALTAAGSLRSLLEESE